MNVKITKNTKTEIEGEIESDNPVIMEMLINKLNTYEEVEFAAYSWDHPFIKNQRFYVRTKGKEAKEMLDKAIKEIKKDLKKLKEDVSGK